MENEIKNCLEVMKGIKYYTNNIFSTCEEIRKAKNCLSIAEPIKNYINILDKSKNILCKNINYYVGNKRESPLTDINSELKMPHNMDLSEKEKLMILISLRNLDSFILQELSKCEAGNIRIPCFFKGLKSVTINEKDTRKLVKKFLNEIED